MPCLTTMILTPPITAPPKNAPPPPPNKSIFKPYKLSMDSLTRVMNGSINVVALPPLLPPQHHHFPNCTNNTPLNSSSPVPPLMAKIYKSNQDVGNGGGGSEWTMCSIILEFPRECWDHVRPCAHGHRHHRDKNEEGNSKASLAGRTLKQHTERELRRLLTMAGLEYEGVSEEELGTMQYDNNDEGTNWFGSKSRKKGPEEWTLLDHFLYELGIELKADLSSSTSSHEQYGKSFAFYGRNASRGGKRSKRYDAPPTYSHVHA
eukprot:CCRYP_011431-RA/>CCRYP_011431-RA protein AED:0.24 eAED:0.24 QI:0/-1/0/1/-1/1/1/0/261